MGIADGIERFYDRPRSCSQCGTTDAELVRVGGALYCQDCAEDRALREDLEAFEAVVDRMEQGVLPDRYATQARDLLHRANAAVATASQLT